MGVDEGGLFVSIASELCRLVKFGAFHGYAGWLSNFKKERKEGKKEGRKKKIENTNRFTFGSFQQLIDLAGLRAYHNSGRDLRSLELHSTISS